MINHYTNAISLNLIPDQTKFAWSEADLRRIHTDAKGNAGEVIRYKNLKVTYGFSEFSTTSFCR